MADDSALSFIKGKKLKISITLFFVFISLCALLQVFDAYGEKFTDEGFKRSLISFGIAKGLNGAISLVQGTEVALEPAGVGVIFTPGQVLDPVNDLVERFSYVMLVCATSLGIQAVLLKIFASNTYSVIVIISLLLALTVIWKDGYSTNIKNLALRIAVFFLILRFFIPFMAIASDGLYKGFLETAYTESTNQLQRSDKAVTSITEESVIPDNVTTEITWYEYIRKNIDIAIQSIDIQNKIDKLKVEVEAITNHVIDLIVVFTLQTIIFPLLFLWLTLKLLKINYSFKYI